MKRCPSLVRVALGVLVASLGSAGCLVKIRPHDGPPAPPSAHFLRTDDAPTLPGTPPEAIRVIGGPLDDRTAERLGLVVVLLNDDAQFRNAALLEMRKAASVLGADSVAEVRVNPWSISGVAARARPAEIMLGPSPNQGIVVKDSTPPSTGVAERFAISAAATLASDAFAGRAVDPAAMPPRAAAPSSVLLFSASRRAKAAVPVALVATCQPLPIEAAADALKAQAAGLGASAVVDVRLVVDEMPCDSSPFVVGPFARLSGLAVREL
jgi:uncharacterized protein YbjQ (UPF0145 family)